MKRENLKAKNSAFYTKYFDALKKTRLENFVYNKKTNQYEIKSTDLFKLQELENSGDMTKFEQYKSQILTNKENLTKKQKDKLEKRIQKQTKEEKRVQEIIEGREKNPKKELYSTSFVRGFQNLKYKKLSDSRKTYLKNEFKKRSEQKLLLANDKKTKKLELINKKGLNKYNSMLAVDSKKAEKFLQKHEEKMSKLTQKPAKVYSSPKEGYYNFIWNISDNFNQKLSTVKSFLFDPYHKKTNEVKITNGNVLFNMDSTVNTLFLNKDDINIDTLKKDILGLTSPQEERHYIHVKDTNLQLRNFFINNLLIFLIIIYVIVVTIIKPRFMSLLSIQVIIKNATYNIPIALGVAGIIVLTGTDLSAGRIVGLTSLVTASLLQSTGYVGKMFPALQVSLGVFPLFIVVVLVLVVLIGGLFGLVNGFFAAKFKLHPFIVTLATGLIVYAISLKYITLGTQNGKAISGLSDTFKDAVSKSIGNSSIPYYVIYVLLLIIVMWTIWNKTTIGKNMFAVGANPEAATVSGISVFKTTLIVFGIAGMTYGLNGFITSAYVGSNDAATAVNFELDAIAACVIGGVSFNGGVGKISGVIIGVFLLQLITSSLIFLSVDPNVQYFVKGGVILLASAIDMRKYIVKK